MFERTIYSFTSDKPTISHRNYLDQVNSWKNLWKFWNCPLRRNKSDPSILLNVAVYWKSSNTEASAKKLSQILANNIDNGVRGVGLKSTEKQTYEHLAYASQMQQETGSFKQNASTFV